MKYIHVVSQFKPKDTLTQRRIQFATEQWVKQYRRGPWIRLNVPDSSMPRLFSDTNRKVPYVKDLIMAGCSKADDGDVVVLTNSDIIPCESMTDQLNLCFGEGYSACYSYRRDIESQTAIPDAELPTRSRVFAGLDFFAAKKGSWTARLPAYPDMLYATEAWDYLMKIFMRTFGAKEFRFLIYHVIHTSEIERNHDSLSQKHNRELGSKYLRFRGILPYWESPVPIDMNPQ